MKTGHADAQYMFLAIGKALHYRTRLTWSRELPTDGVWLLPGDGYLLPEAPAVALEVAVSEGPKAIKGSIDTLAEVSPALGVLVINEDEIRRGALRNDVPTTSVERGIENRIAAACDRVSRHQQRIEIWSFKQLTCRYRLATGESTPPMLARLTA
jgi:hypothetical protein